MNEFDNSMISMKKALRVQFFGGSVLIAGTSAYHGAATGAWSGAVMFAGGAMAVLSALVWLMRLKAVERLKSRRTTKNGEASVIVLMSGAFFMVVRFFIRG